MNKPYKQLDLRKGRTRARKGGKVLCVIVKRKGIASAAATRASEPSPQLVASHKIDYNMFAI
jgi:hypothetical protein